MTAKIQSADCGTCGARSVVVGNVDGGRSGPGLVVDGYGSRAAGGLGSETEKSATSANVFAEANIQRVDPQYVGAGAERDNHRAVAVATSSIADGKSSCLEVVGRVRQVHSSLWNRVDAYPYIKIRHIDVESPQSRNVEHRPAVMGEVRARRVHAHVDRGSRDRQCSGAIDVQDRIGR